MYSQEKKGCIERYKQCNYYEQYTFIEDRNKEECESIEYFDDEKGKFNQTYKCVFESNDNKCKQTKKECSDITDKDFCFSYNFGKIARVCVYKFGGCKEQYEFCEYAPTTSCGSVTIFDNDNTIDYTKRCIYDPNDRECYETTIGKETCYKSSSESSCIHTNSEYDKRCLIDTKGVCVEKYISCPSYSSKQECNSINLASSSEKCFYDEEKDECIQIKKDCSEYKGTNEYTCMNNYDSQDKDKKCFMENGHCIEKYIYCENYTGTNAC